ncbi:MAG: hypothetical protein GQ527_07755 [Bacteroidales bacterium]|nr:hypothetical protein [Bacteroidales bacterium]
MEFKKFFRSLFFIFILGFLVWSPLFYFNVIVDPYGVFLKLYHHFPSEPNKRYMKMQYLKKHPVKFDSYIFGSSRMNSLNPDHIPNDKGNWYNMTYSLGLPKDHLQDIKYMIEQGINVKNVVIGIDYLGLLRNPDFDQNNLGRKKYPESLIEKIEFYKRYLFNMPDINFMKLMYIKRELDWRDLLINGIIKSGGDKIIEQDKENHMLHPKFRMPSSSHDYGTDIKKNLIPINEIVELAEKNHINLIFFLNPIHHATQLNLNQLRYFDALHQLADVTDFYDFSGINSVTLNNENYHETSHFREKIGDMIISRILNYPENFVPFDFGNYVNRENIESHLEQQYSQINTYFNAIDLSNHYQVPKHFPLTKKLNRTSNIQIQSINDFENITDTLLISSPLLQIWGQSKTVEELDYAFIQIDDKLFEIENSYINENQTNTSLKNIKWEKSIPVRFIENGYHKIRILNLENDGYFFSDEIHIKVIGIDVAYPKIENLQMIPEKANIMLHQKHISSNFFPNLSNQFIYLSGWSYYSKQQLPTGGIIATVNGHIFKSQFLIERNDLVNNLNNPNLRFAGWGLIIPSYTLKDGANKITFTALHRNNINYLMSSKEISIYKHSSEKPNYLEDITLDTLKTKYTINIINDQNKPSASNPQVIQWPLLKLNGWAIDFPNQNIADGIVIDIDGNQFMATYRISRPDVANAYKNPNYTNSGWSFDIPTEIIGKGSHTVSIKIILDGGKSYYKTDKMINFIIE